VVIQDDTVDRTTDGRGRVHELSFRALKKLDAGSWKGESFRGERIPSLEEVFEVCRYRVMVNLDLKTLDAIKPLADLIKAWDYEDQLVITGKVPACVDEIRRLECFPTMFFETGATFSSLQKSGNHEAAIRTAIAAARRQGLPGFLFHHAWVNQRITHLAHLHGLAVNVWGVDKKETVKRMLDANVDAVMCDDPAIALTEM
jgi:glycerophosphoryl diester phosphodiesterase